MIPLRRLAGFFALVSLSGCSSGQTGSPDCVGPISCVCDRLYTRGVLLRVRAESATDGVTGSQLQAVVEEVLSPVDQAFGLTPGERVGGSVLFEQPCGPHAPALRAGAEFFVLYNPFLGDSYPSCDALEDCLLSSCVQISGNQLECAEACEARTASACAAAREQALLAGVFSWALPWTEPLSFGGETTLPTSDLHVLDSVESCLERFPASQPPPCHDVVVNRCSATGASPEGRSGGFGALGAVTALIAASRFRRTRARRSRG